MNTRLLTIFFALLCLSTGAAAQCPPNIGFEDGNLSHWETTTGTVSATGGMTLGTGGPVWGRHEIVDAASGNDEYGGFPKLCPYGGRYSVKLGNEDKGSEAEGISYTITVPANLDTFSLTYFYAVVFENPGHQPIEQPRFVVLAYDVNTGQEVSCATFDYVASGSIPGFKQAPTRTDVRYKEWTPASIQFTGLGGHTIRLEFRTADCTRGGHFGYGYIDVAADCTGMMAVAPFCAATNSLVMNAPYGYESYTWFSSDFSTVMGNGQSLVLSPPPVTSGYFWVVLFPYPGYGCKDTLKAIVTPMPVPDTPRASGHIYYCKGMNPQPLAAEADSGNLLIWYTSEFGSNGNTMAPVPQTDTVRNDTFWVAQKPLFGCESLRRPVVVHVVNSIPIDFTIDKPSQCLPGNVFRFTNTSYDIGRGNYFWDFGDGQTAASLPGESVTHSFATAKSYNVKLTLAYAGACSNSIQHTVAVIPKPVANFITPGGLCEGMTSAQFADSSYATGSTIATWWWEFDGIVSTLQVPPPAAVSGNSVRVRLAVSSPEGCLSDTLTRVVTLNKVPVAAFTYSSRCENEPTIATDASFFPGAPAGESIAAWQWTLDGSVVSSQRSPVLSMGSGTHHLQLEVTSAHGCRSNIADSTLAVMTQPSVDLTWDDSCARRPLPLRALDLSGDVVEWQWKVASGWTAGGASNTPTFVNGGNVTIGLIGVNAARCRDTVLRVLHVNDVATTAGRDTIAAIGQPIQLQALNAQPRQVYQWTPDDGLDDNDIANPVALEGRDITYALAVRDSLGCTRTSTVQVKRFIGPELYVPTGFTPDRNGRNDLLRVIPVGIRDFHYFAIYDRNGQLIFRTTRASEGWDGTFGGRELTTSTFVYVTEGTDFTGRRLLRKGTVTLVR